jgi:hypothetical protein
MSSCLYSIVFDQTVSERKPSLSNRASPVITHTISIRDKITNGNRVNQGTCLILSRHISSLENGVCDRGEYYTVNRDHDKRVQ